VRNNNNIYNSNLHFIDSNLHFIDSNQYLINIKNDECVNENGIKAGNECDEENENSRND